MFPSNRKAQGLVPTKRITFGAAQSASTSYPYPVCEVPKSKNNRKALGYESMRELTYGGGSTASTSYPVSVWGAPQSPNDCKALDFEPMREITYSRGSTASTSYPISNWGAPQSPNDGKALGFETVRAITFAGSESNASAVFPMMMKHNGPKKAKKGLAFSQSTVEEIKPMKQVSRKPSKMIPIAAAKMTIHPSFHFTVVTKDLPTTSKGHPTSSKAQSGNSEVGMFSGETKDYPLFRQNLVQYFKRDKSLDVMEKASFLMSHLEAKAKQFVQHFMSPITKDSYELILARLDLVYRWDKGDTDEVALSKLASLKNLKVLNSKNILRIITVVEAALGPLNRMYPDDDGYTLHETFERLLKILPVVERGLFIGFCAADRLTPNIESYLDFLRSKYDSRIKDDTSEKPNPVKKVRTKASAMTEVKPKVKKIRNPVDPDAPPKVKKVRKLVGTNGPHVVRTKAAARTQKIPKAEVTTSCQVDTQKPHEDLKTERNIPLKEMTMKNKPEASKVPRSKCKACEKVHGLGFCQVFRALKISDRRKLVTDAKACKCCLAIGHDVKDCTKLKKCNILGCSLFHHQLLHTEVGRKILDFEESGGM